MIFQHIILLTLFAGVFGDDVEQALGARRAKRINGQEHYFNTAKYACNDDEYSTSLEHYMEHRDYRQNQLMCDKFPAELASKVDTSGAAERESVRIQYTKHTSEFVNLNCKTGEYVSQIENWMGGAYLENMKTVCRKLPGVTTPTGNGFYPSTAEGCHWGDKLVNGPGWRPYVWEQCRSGEYIQSIEFSKWYHGKVWYLRTWCCPLSTTHFDKLYQLLGYGWGRPPASECSGGLQDDDCRVNGFESKKGEHGQLGMWAIECKSKCNATPDCIGYTTTNKAYADPGRCYIYTTSSTNGGQGWVASPEKHKTLGPKTSVWGVGGSDKVEAWVVASHAHFGLNDYEYIGAGFCRSNSCSGGNADTTACLAKGVFTRGLFFKECYEACDQRSSCLGFAFEQQARSFDCKCVLYGDLCDGDGWKKIDGSLQAIDVAVVLAGRNTNRCYKKPNTEPTATSTCGAVDTELGPESDNPMNDECADGEHEGFNIDHHNKYYGCGLRSRPGKAETCGEVCKTNSGGCWGFVTYYDDCYVYTSNVRGCKLVTLDGAKIYKRCCTAGPIQAAESSVGYYPPHFPGGNQGESSTLAVIPEEYTTSPVVSFFALIGAGAAVFGVYSFAMKGKTDHVDREF